jgi:autotransporter-associated beta strand protein
MKLPAFSTALFALLAAASTASAANVTWDGGSAGTSNSWGVSSVWDNNDTSPTTEDDVFIGGTPLTANSPNLGSATLGIVLTSTSNSTFSPSVKSVTFDNSLGQFSSTSQLLPVGTLNFRNSSANTPGNNSLVLNTAGNTALTVKGGNATVTAHVHFQHRAATANLTINLSYFGTSNFNIADNSLLTFSGNITGNTTAIGAYNPAPMLIGTGGFNKTGNGTLRFNAVNTYAGNTKVSAGTLEVNNALALQNSALDTSGTGNLTLNASITNLTLGGLTGSAPLASAITSGYSTITNLTLNPPSGFTNAYSGVIADGASGMTLTKTGAGAQVLSGNSTYTGATSVNAGVLVFSNTAAKAPGALSVADAGGIGLGVGASPTFYTSADVDALFNNTLSGFTLSTSSGVGIDTTAGNFTYATSQSAARSLTKTGANTLSLTGTNTFTGGLNIFGGTLAITSADNLGSDAALNPTAVVVNGGILSKTGAGAATSALNRGFNVGSAIGTFNVADPAGTLVIGGVIGNVSGQAGALLKTGPGTLTFSGNNTNTFTGGITISEGTLSVDTASAICSAATLNTSAITLNGGILKFTAAPVRSGANRAFRLSNATSTIDVDTGVEARIQGGMRDVIVPTTQNGILRKIGNGTLSVEHSTLLTYTGGTLLQAGTLRINNNLLGGGATIPGLSVSSGATLEGSGTVYGASSFANGSSIRFATYETSNSTLVPNPATSAIGTITFNGTLTLGDANLAYDLDTPAASDRLVVASTGSLDIGNGTLDLTNFAFTAGAGYADGIYPLITTSSAITGTLGSPLTGTSGGKSVTLAINGTNIELTVSSVVADTTPPAAPTVGLLAASDTGSSSSDLITNLTTPTLRVTLNGTGPTAPLAGDVVNLFNGATQVASATLSAGDISATFIDLTSVALSPGSLSFTATVTDAASNVSDASTPLPVTLDTNAPVITVTSPSSNSAAWGATYTDAGATATDNITPFTAAVITTNPVNTATPGVYTVTYNATDVAGNTATPATRNVTVAIANATTVGADGLSPLMKYAFGANSPTDTVQAPALSSTATTLSITAVVRTNDPAVVVSGEAVNDLTGTWGTGGTVTMTVAGDQTNLPANCQRRVFTVDTTAATRKFLRLKVVSTP